MTAERRASDTSLAPAPSLRAIFVESVLEHFGEHQECDNTCTHADMEERAAMRAWQDFQVGLALAGWTVSPDGR